MPVRPNGVRTFAIAAPVFPQIGHSIVPVSTAPAHLQDGLYALPSTVFTVATLATLQPLAPTSTLLNRRQFDTTEENGHTACTVCGQAATHTDVITHILGQWTSVTAWCLIFYSVGSVFLLLWFWSIGWIDRRLSVSHVSHLCIEEDVRKTKNLTQALAYTTILGLATYDELPALL